MKVSTILVVTFIFTLLSGLYIVKPLVIDATVLKFGFPFHWLIATRGEFGLPYGPWYFTFVWNWFIVDFAIYGLLVTIGMGIYEKTLKRVSKPKAYRIFFWSSYVMLIICCWVMILWILLWDFLLLKMRFDTFLGIWRWLCFLLGVVTVIFTWFLIKYLKQVSTP